MALTSSHPFRLAAAEPHRRQPRVLVNAKKDPPFSFKFGKRGSSNDGASRENGGNQNGLSFFDLNGKLPNVKSLVPVVSSSSKSLFAPGQRRKDPNTVFVAGATGQTGVRLVQMLLRKGFAVRAGVLDLAAAQELAQLAVQYKLISPEESRRLNAVESPLLDAEAIAKAIGNASKVVITVGRGESGPSGEVTAENALGVVRGAQLSGVRHVALVYDTASSGFGGSSTYNVLDGLTSFFSNLFLQTQPLALPDLLAKIAETDVACTVLKASLADDYASDNTGGIVVEPESGGGSTSTASISNKVTKSQIASLIADIFSNVEVAENRVVEVSTSPTATSKTIEELFSGIPVDGRRAAYKEAQEKAKAEEAARLASEEAQRATEAAKKLEQAASVAPRRQARVSKPVEEPSEETETAGLPLNGDALRRAAQGIKIDFSWEKLSKQLRAVTKITKGEEEDDDDDEPKVRVATTRGQAKARALRPQKAVVKAPPQPPKKKVAQAAPAKRETRKVFGGLFKQETIYIDED